MKIDLEELNKTKEKWITELMKDYPNADRTMCEIVVEKYLKDPIAFDEMLTTDFKPIERNTEYKYNGVSVEDVSQNIIEKVEDQISSIII
jgi:hypothetical protein